MLNKGDWKLEGSSYDEVFALLSGGSFSSGKVEIHDVVVQLMGLRGKKAADQTVRETTDYKGRRFRVVKYFMALEEFGFGKFKQGRRHITSSFEWTRSFEDFRKFMRGELSIDLPPKGLKGQTPLGMEEFKIPVSHGTLKFEIPTIYSEEDLKRAIELVMQLGRRKNPNFKP